MAHVCNCTNQCPACGQCCAVGCEHRGFARSTITPGTTTTPLPPLPVGEIRLIPQYPLTEEDVKRIVREALAEALEELRALKGEAA